VTTEAEPQELRIIHSSTGRLRVHCPDPGGHIINRLRGLPGVTSTSASARTNNILVLFDPQLTDPGGLCEEIRTLALEPAPAPLRVAPPVIIPIGFGAENGTSVTAIDVLEPDADPTALVPLTGFRRRVFQTLGWTSVGMAGVGAVLPVVPTVPFALLAGYFFVRSSPSAHAWLLRSRWFGPALRDWEEHRAVSRSMKYTAVALMGAGLLVTLMVGLPAEIVAAILILEAIGLIIVLRLPEVEALPAPPALEGA
jgi:uncharacterized membrane protein YbaN (DUF454 family)